MPIIAIVIGLAVLIGVGSYMMRPTEPTTPPDTTISEAPTTDTPVVAPETPTAPVANDAVVTTPATEPPATTATTPETPTVDTVYENGVYNTVTEYRAPNNAQHVVTVNLTLANDVVTAATVSYSGDNVAASKNYQNKFDAALPTQVIGKKLDTISLSRVGGASLTTDAFNKAVIAIKADAKI